MVNKESAHIEEWIRFHLCAGFQHMYILDEGTEDDTKNMLLKYKDKGLVTLFDSLELKQGQSRQKEFNKMCMNSTKQDGEKWVAFIDASEFLYPTNGGTIGSAMRGYSAHSAVAVPRTTYGTSHFKQRSEYK